jgi:hypothetical protein
MNREKRYEKGLFGDPRGIPFLFAYFFLFTNSFASSKALFEPFGGAQEFPIPQNL